MTIIHQLPFDERAKLLNNALTLTNTQGGIQD